MIVNNDYPIYVGDAKIVRVYNNEEIIYGYGVDVLNLKSGVYNYQQQTVTFNNISNSLKEYFENARSTTISQPYTIQWLDGSVLTNVISADKTNLNKYYFHIKAIGARSNLLGFRDAMFLPIYIVGNTMTFNLTPDDYNGYDIDRWSTYYGNDNNCQIITFTMNANERVEVLDRDFSLNHPLVTIYGNLSNHSVKIRRHHVPRVRWYRDNVLIFEGAREVDTYNETWATNNTSVDPITVEIRVQGDNTKINNINNNLKDIKIEYQILNNEKILPETCGYTKIQNNRFQVQMMRRLKFKIKFVLNDDIIYTVDYNNEYGIDAHNAVTIYATV